MPTFAVSDDEYKLVLRALMCYDTCGMSMTKRLAFAELRERIEAQAPDSVSASDSVSAPTSGSDIAAHDEVARG